GIGADHRDAAGNAEGTHVPLDLTGGPKIALDQYDRIGAPAEGFQADGAGAGKEVKERPDGHGVAQDTEERLAHHLRNGPQPLAPVAGQLPPPALPRHDSKLHAHSHQRLIPISSPKTKKARGLRPRARLNPCYRVIRGIELTC